MTSSACGDGGRRRFWRRHLRLPACFFSAALIAVIAGHLDLQIADAVFFDREADVWIGAQTWWAVDLIHTGGALFIRLVGIAAIATLALSFWLPAWRHFRRGAAYLALGLILVPTVVATLKQLTNVDCPWDLERYGGDRPYVALLDDRPDDLPRARCFPGSHASSGFALMAGYFLLLGRRPLQARQALAAAILIGTVFSIGQQARGAHFLSHDLTSAAIAWFTLLALWRLLLAPAAEAVQPQVVQGDREWKEIGKDSDGVVLAEGEVQKQQQASRNAHVPERRGHCRPAVSR